MNKNKQIVPVVFLLSIVIFFALAIGLILPAVQEYSETNLKSKKTSETLTSKKDDFDKMQEKQKQEELQIKAVKQVHESNTSKAAENMSAFGTMFDDMIKNAQRNDLLIRSIEYDLKPISDAIYQNNSVAFNVCELKLFLVGTYAQLRGFLNDVTTNYPYLISVSKLNVTAFEGNTDYIVIRLSLMLYSKKAMPE